MSTLVDTWDELVAALELADFTVVDYIPAAVEPPLIIIVPGDPYLTPSDAYGDDFIVSLSLIVVFAPAEGSSITTAANEALTTALAAVPLRWSVVDVSPPFRATNAGGLPASRIRLSTTV